MKRNNTLALISQDKLNEHKQRAAFHSAGYAAAVYLHNKAKDLPPVPFKITFHEISRITTADGIMYKTPPGNFIAQTEGGRAIEQLPESIDCLARTLTETNDAMARLLDDYQLVFEADIVNLLAGALAEAKHIADTDDELFNHRLVNLNALRNYGGDSGLALLDDYLGSFFSGQPKNQKLDALFSEAFDFVNHDANWFAITKLAHRLLDNSPKQSLRAEEIGNMLDQCIANFTERRSTERHRDNAWFKITAHHIKANCAKNAKYLHRPSPEALDAMTHTEKDRLILALFDLLESQKVLPKSGK
ncbi:MAG: hypothetical protein ACXWF8_05775 [Methylobacter sp.]